MITTLDTSVSVMDKVSLPVTSRAIALVSVSEMSKVSVAEKDTRVEADSVRLIPRVSLATAVIDPAVVSVSVIDSVFFAITYALLNYRFKVCLLEWLREVILSTHADRLHDFSRVADTGEHDYFKLWMNVTNVF